MVPAGAEQGAVAHQVKELDTIQGAQPGDSRELQEHRQGDFQLPGRNFKEHGQAEQGAEGQVHGREEICHASSRAGTYRGQSPRAAPYHGQSSRTEAYRGQPSVY